MNTFTTQFEQLLVEAMFGLLVMSIVLIVNIYTFTEISLVYRRSLLNHHFRSRHIELMKFLAHMIVLVFAQFLSLSIWVGALVLFDFVNDWVTAIMLTASFFTSVGNFTANLPVGWRLIPSVIAFTGLFSFAWATAATMTMARSLTDFLEKHKEV
jgi:hypothetical protein